MMPRRHFLTTAATSLMAATLTPQALRAAGPLSGQTPNVLFVFPDQFRLNAMGFWKKERYRPHLNTEPDPVVTPHLDGFADESVVLTHAVAIHPVCSPFRAMLMSGAFPSQNGVSGNCSKKQLQHNLKGDLECLPDAFAKAGFATGYFGKTHWNTPTAEFDEQGNWLGSGTKGSFYNDYDSYVAPGPHRHGVETWLHTVKDNHNDPTFYSNRPDMVGGKEDGQAFQPGIFSSRAESERVIAWLKNKNGERNGKKPFFGIWAPNPPHSPYSQIGHVEKEVYDKYYRDKPPKELLVRPNVRGEGAKKAAASAAFYFSNVTSVDQYFGNILQTLKEEGLYENTIVVFTADHGEMMGSQGLMAKNNPFDEAYRIPFLIRWPRVLAPAFCHNMIGPVDMMPTLLGLAGKANFTPKTCQGKDLSFALRWPGSKPVGAETMPIILGDQEKRGVRSHHHTLVLDGKGKRGEETPVVTVYDNMADPYQMKPLTLEDISTEDRQFLLRETVRWLEVAADGWCDKRKFSRVLPWI